MSHAALRFNKNCIKNIKNINVDNDNLNLAEVKNLRKKGREFIAVLREFFPQDMRFTIEYPWGWASYAQILWNEHQECDYPEFQEGFDLLNKLDEIDNQD